MNYFPTMRERGVTAVIGATPEKAILEVITQLALIEEVHVIVGGRCFNAQNLACEVGRHTVMVDATMKRIMVVRPFNCLQMVQLLEDAKPATPIVILDMLTTFYDAGVPAVDSLRLLQRSATQLRRLGQQAPILVTLRPCSPPHRTGLVKIIRGVAKRVYIFGEPEVNHPDRLF